MSKEYFLLVAFTKESRRGLEIDLMADLEIRHGDIASSLVCRYRQLGTYRLRGNISPGR